MAVATRLLAAARPLFEGECDFLVAEGVEGELGVLPQHAPLFTWLRPGEVMVRQKGEEQRFFLEDGYLEVLPNRVSILSRVGRPSSELDPAAAAEEQRAVEEALARLGPGEPEERSRLDSRLEVAKARLLAAQRARRRNSA